MLPTKMSTFVPVTARCVQTARRNTSRFLSPSLPFSPSLSLSCRFFKCAQEDMCHFHMFLSVSSFRIISIFTCMCDNLFVSLVRYKTMDPLQASRRFDTTVHDYTTLLHRRAHALTHTRDDSRHALASRETSRCITNTRHETRRVVMLRVSRTDGKARKYRDRNEDIRRTYRRGGDATLITVITTACNSANTSRRSPSASLALVVRSSRVPARPRDPRSNLHDMIERPINASRGLCICHPTLS